jgi:hypothetical protein
VHSYRKHDYIFYYKPIVAKNTLFVNAYMGFVAITHLQIIEKSGKYLLS